MGAEVMVSPFKRLILALVAAWLMPGAGFCAWSAKKLPFIGDTETEASLRVQPLEVAYLGRKHVVKDGRVALGLVLTFTNLTDKDAEGFSGKVVFRLNDGHIYSRDIDYRHPISAGKTARLTIAISGDDPKNYLKFLKAKSIKAVCVDQKLY